MNSSPDSQGQNYVGGEEPRPAKWTLLLYMAAGKDPKLEAAAIRDLRELEAVGGTVDAHVLAFVQRDWPGSDICQITNGQSILVDAVDEAGANEPRRARRSREDDNTGRKETLIRFLRTALKKAPAEKYALVLWGHAYGLGFGRFHDDPLTLRELREALEWFNTTRGKKLDLLVANACAMSHVEAAHELHAVANYLVSSQISVPFAGLPYDVILRSMRENPTDKDLGGAIVDAYISSFSASPGSERVAMTMLNLKLAGDGEAELKALFWTLAEGLGKRLEKAQKSDPNFAEQVREVFLSMARGDVEPLIDVKRLCQELRTWCEPRRDKCGSRDDKFWFVDKEFWAAVQRLEEFVTCAGPGETKLVMRHEAHSEIDDLNGLSLFAPFLASDFLQRRLGLLGGDATAGTTDRAYRSLKLFGNGDQRSRWPTIVYGMLHQSVPEMVIDCVDGCGATDPGSRSEIAQLVIQLHSVFNRFDSVVRTCRDRVIWSVGKIAIAPGLDRKAMSTKLISLRLLDSNRLLAVASGSDGNGMPGKSYTVEGPAQDTPEACAIDCVRTSFEAIESALERLERTTRRILTNENFGLGPPAGRSPALLGVGRQVPPSPIKHSSDLGLGDLKHGNDLGLGDLKHGNDLGLDSLKHGNDMGLLSNGIEGIKASLAAILATASSDDHTALGIVASLFGHVGSSLQAVEDVLAGAEDIAAGAVCSEPSNQAVADATAVVAKQQLTRAFRILDETSMSARRTVLRVVAHPTYGLGPGPDEMTADDRRELAVAGGLSCEALRLL